MVKQLHLECQQKMLVIICLGVYLTIVTMMYIIVSLQEITLSVPKIIIKEK